MGYWGGKSKDLKYVWWKTSQLWRKIREENQIIDSIKNLPIQTKDGRRKPNNSGIRFKWFKKVYNSIFYCKKDANNA